MHDKSPATLARAVSGGMVGDTNRGVRHMAKSDWETSDVDESHPQPLIYEEPFAPHVTLGRVVLGAFAVLTSVGGAVFWANRNRTLISNEELGQRHESVTLAALPQQPLAQAEIQEVPAGPPAQRAEALPVSPMLEAPALVKDRMSVSFTAPAEGATVGSTWLVRGMARGIPEGKQLWLVTQREPELGFWPRELLTLGADGSFEQQVWDQGTRGPLSICLLATNTTDTMRFNDWLLVGDRDDIWPALHQIEGRSTMLGCQDIQMDPNIKQ
jgi:hypothetical protein